MTFDPPSAKRRRSSSERDRAMQLLIVEDHPGFREALTKGLSAAGFTIAAACASGEEALELLDAIRPDAAIVDLGLVGMRGSR